MQKYIIHIETYSLDSSYAKTVRITNTDKLPLAARGGMASHSSFRDFSSESIEISVEHASRKTTRLNGEISGIKIHVIKLIETPTNIYFSRKNGESGKEISHKPKRVKEQLDLPQKEGLDLLVYCYQKETEPVHKKDLLTRLRKKIAPLIGFIAQKIK